MSDSCDPLDCSLSGSSVLRDSPGQNTGVGSLCLLQGIFLTQELNPGLLHCRRFFTDWATREALMDNIFSLIKKNKQTTLFKRKDDYFPSKILTVLAEEVSCDTEKYHLLWLLLPKQPLPSAAGLTQTSASPSWRKSSSGNRAIQVSRVKWTPSPVDNVAEASWTECVIPLNSCGSSLTAPARMILPNHRMRNGGLFTDAAGASLIF